MTFFNTINAEGQTLLNFNQKAKSQNELVMEVFDTYFRPLTPFEVNKVLESWGFKYPITSVRRAINTLTGEGRLRKCGEQRQGEYGVMNCTWVKR